MTYAVKEIFYTLQGEGQNTGKPAVFCRFTGCNLWTGREQDRASAVCQFCDTDFVGTDGHGGGLFQTPEKLTKSINDAWADGCAEQKFVVLTGGEPVLQLDGKLIDNLHNAGFEIALETNGTLPVPDGVDWVCVSPKGNSDIVVRTGDELKLVYPQPELDPVLFEDWNFTHHFLQPMDKKDCSVDTVQKTIDYCLSHSRWRLSLQTHKILKIP